jgi:hypothetical protein
MRRHRAAMRDHVSSQHVMPYGNSQRGLAWIFQSRRRFNSIGSGSGKELVYERAHGRK